MPSSYTARLKLERQTSGENSGTWGDLVNYTFNRLDAGIDGWANVNVAGSANVTLTSNNATLNTDDSTTDDEVHNRTIEFFGALTGNINVFSGDVENSFTVFNNTSGSYTLTFGPTTGTGVALTQGTKTIVYSDGSTMLDVMADLGPVTSTALTVGDGAASGVLTSSGAYDLTLNTNAGTNSGEITITDAANGNIAFTTNGTGGVVFNDAAFSPETTLTDAATITWDVQDKPVTKVTLTDNRIVGLPTNGQAGQFISLLIIQDATGSRTLTWNAVFEFPSETAPTLTTTGALADLFVFTYHNSKWLQVGSTLALTVA